MPGRGRREKPIRNRELAGRYENKNPKSKHVSVSRMIHLQARRIELEKTGLGMMVVRRCEYWRGLASRVSSRTEKKIIVYYSENQSKKKKIVFTRIKYPRP